MHSINLKTLFHRFIVLFDKKNVVYAEQFSWKSLMTIC